MVLFFSVAFGFGAFEVYSGWKLARSGGWHDLNTVFDPELGWAPACSRGIQGAWGRVSSNRQGFRSGELDPTKPQIACLGDSVVWGYGVDDAETLPARLQTQVEGLGYQVSNLGVSGYGLGQYYLYLKRHIDSLRNLRFVILVIDVSGEMEDTASNNGFGKRRPFFRPNDDSGELQLVGVPIKQYCLRNMLSMSHSVSALQNDREKLAAAIGYVAGDRQLPEKEAEQVAVALLRKIKDLTASHHAELVILVSPLIRDFGVKSPELTQIEKLLNENDFQYVDLFRIMKERGWNSQSFYFDGEHYSPRGNGLVADILFQDLKKRGLDPFTNK